jgi:hypothetical protein
VVEAHKKHEKEKYGKYLAKYKAHMGDFFFILFRELCDVILNFS